MTKSRGAIVVCSLLGFAVACGSFGESDQPSSTPASADGGPGDATEGTDGSVAPVDAAFDPHFCNGHGAALFCADFEQGDLMTSFRDEVAYGSVPVAMELTPAPDRALLVTLPTTSGNVGRELLKDIVFPASLSVSFELSAATSVEDQLVEIIDVTKTGTNTRLTATLVGGAVKAVLFADEPAFDQSIDLGPLPSEPTRFMMKLTATHFVAQRANEPEKSIPIPATLAVAFAGANDLSVGVFFVENPAGGSFRLDDILVVP